MVAVGDGDVDEDGPGEGPPEGGAVIDAIEAGYVIGRYPSNVPARPPAPNIGAGPE